MALPFEGLDTLARIEQVQQANQRPAQMQQMQPPAQMQQMQPPAQTQLQMVSPETGLQNIVSGQIIDGNGLPVSPNPSDAVGQVTNIAGQYAMANPQKTAPFAAGLAAFHAGAKAADMIDKGIQVESEKEDLNVVKDVATSLPNRTRTNMPAMAMPMDRPVQTQEEIQVSEVAPSIMTMREGGRITSKQLKPLLDMGVPENELREIILKESSSNPRAVNPASKAVGLFQFTSAAIEDLNTFKKANVTKDKILKMSVPEQVNLYKKYLERWSWKPGTSLGVMQAAPAFANRSKDAVVYKKGSKAAEGNKQWQDSTGKITIGSIENFYKYAPKEEEKKEEIAPPRPRMKPMPPSEDLERLALLEQTAIETPVGTESKDIDFIGSAREAGKGLLNLLNKNYKVERGDTLSSIAEQSGVSVEELLESNPNIVDRDKIYAGQEVDIPSMKSFVGKFKNAFGLQEGGDVGEYFEGQVEGRGDGMSDEIPFQVEGGDPDVALLSKDEFVIPADVVAMLGNGSSDAGSDKLYDFLDDTRKEAFGRKEQQTEIDAEKGLSSIV